MTQKLFTPESFSKEDYDLLQKAGFRFVKDRHEDTWHITILFNRQRCGWSYCWNIDVVKDIINLLKLDSDVNSDEVYNRFYKRLNIITYEYEQSFSRLHYKHRSGSPHFYNTNRWILENELVAEGDDYYFINYIPMGDTADGSIHTKKLYKTLDPVKQIAINAIQKQIESAIEFKELIEKYDMTFHQ